jgi:tagatose-1,6-bisphosphate aldolase non-catalytic subunit AgaZ/GatZ
MLGVGPMSVNCVDAAIELSNEYNAPIMLIASRRQIDSEQFNGGYVNNWTTCEFTKYVKNKDIKKNIILSRDHGGPWQNNLEIEKKMDLYQAMKSAKDSFKSDIDAGIEVLHIDPSIDIHSVVSKNLLLDRLFELYEFCWDYAKKNNKEISFEIGTEEQSGSTNTLDDLNETLLSVEKFCNKNRIPFPTFVVVQTGTKVMETKNIGTFDSPIRVENEIAVEIQLPKMIEICKNFNVFIKEHNADYLTDQSLLWHPRLGIHAANVAPEFGVAETNALLQILENNNLGSLAIKFIELSYSSKKWHKWMLPNSKSSVRQKAIISGHYIFSTPECVELKKEALFNLKKIGIDLDIYLRNQIKKSIFRYIYNFRLTNIQ